MSSYRHKEGKCNPECPHYQSMGEKGLNGTCDLTGQMVSVNESFPSDCSPYLSDRQKMYDRSGRPVKLPEIQIVDLDYDRHECRVCGNRAEIPGAKLCQHCWGLTVQFEGLWARAPEVGAQWLRAMVKHKGVKVDGGS